MKVIAIWLLFFAYLIFMVFLYMYSDIDMGDSETTENQVDSTEVIPESIEPEFSQEKLDSLQILFYAAYNSQNLDEAHRIADEMVQFYSEHEATDEAVTLLAAHTAPEVEKPKQTSTKQPPRQRARRTASTQRPTRSTQPAVTTPSPVVEVVEPEPESDEIEIEPGISATPEELEEMLARLRTVRDDDFGITWYYNRNLSHFLYKNSFEVYLGKNDRNELWLRMRVYYNGERPLNLTAFELYADDKEYEIPVLRGNVESGEGLKGAWAWYDAEIKKNEYNIVKAVMNSERAAMRYIGVDGKSQRAIGELEKLRLKHIVDAFEALYQNGSYISSSSFFPR